MKVIRHDLGDRENIEILAMADLHLGDQRAAYRKVLEWIEYVRTHDNVFCILNGDLMDTAIVNSLGSTYEASISPMAQIQECVKLFAPIKGKVLLIDPGNHERRALRATSLDMTLIMAEQLGLANVYAPESALLFVRFGRIASAGNHHRPVCYTIYCVHGSGGGRKEGGKMQRLADLASIIDADVYIHSHTHLPAVMKTGYFRVSTANSSVKKVDKLFVNTSSVLEYGGYGEVQSYKPTSLETPIIRLDGTKHHATATL